MNIETCNLCETHYCINSNSKLGKVRVEIQKAQTSDSNRGSVIDVSKVLIENCPIRLEKEKDNIEDRRCY